MANAAARPGTEDATPLAEHGRLRPPPEISVDMRKSHRSHPERATFVRLCAAAAVVMVTTASTSASAEESPYCRKVRARAGAQAALLYAPTVQAQAIKFPNNGTTDSGVTTGAGNQFRASVSFSPLDFYKGFRVASTADADCRHHESFITLQEVLAEGADVGRLPALRRQKELLEARQAVLDALVAKVNERFEAHLSSLLELAEVRGRVAELARKRAQVAGDVARLEALGLDSYRGMLSTLIDQSDRDAMTFEREASHVRSLDAWEFKFSGGIIPQDHPVDYFAVVQVGFNFGAFTHNAQESKYLDARADELKKAKYELHDQVRKYRDGIAIGVTQARRELAIVDKQLEQLTTARASLERAEAPGAAHALSLVEIDIISAESEQTLLTELTAQLSRFQETAK
jgi:hypothetical protein